MDVSSTRSESAASEVRQVTATAAKAAQAASELFSEIRRLRTGAALVASCDAALAARLERAELLQQQELLFQRKGRLAAAEAASTARKRSPSTPKARSPSPVLCQAPVEGLRSNTVAAQIKQLLRETSRHSHARFAAILHAWRDLSRWPQIVENVCDTLEFGLAHERLHFFYCWCWLARLARQEKIAVRLQAEDAAAQLTAEGEVQRATERNIIEAKDVHLKKLMLQIMAWRSSRLRCWAWMNWSLSHAKGRLSKICRVHRLRASSAAERRGCSSLLVAAVGAWRRVAVSFRLWRKAAHAMLGFKLACHSCFDKDYLVLVLHAWRSDLTATREGLALMQERAAHEQTRLQRQHDFESKWQGLLDALHLRKVSSLSSRSAWELLGKVLEAWQLALDLDKASLGIWAAQEELHNHRIQRRRGDACSSLAAAMTTWELEGWLLSSCFIVWAMAKHLNDWREGKARTLRSSIGASTIAFDAAANQLNTLLESELEDEEQERLRLAFCFLDRVVQARDRDRLQKGLHRWKLYWFGHEVNTLHDRAGQEPAKIRHLTCEVEHMQEEAAGQRRLKMSAIFKRFKTWRLSLSHEVLHIWVVAADMARRERIEDAFRCKDIVKQKAEEAQAASRRGGLNQSLGKVLDRLSSERLGRAALKAWVWVSFGQATNRLRKALETNFTTAEQNILERSMSMQSKIASPLVAWISGDKASQELDPETMKLLLVGWRMAKELAKRERDRFARRKRLQQSSMALCVETGTWIESLCMRKAFWTWQLSVSMENSERERSLIASARRERVQRRMLLQKHVQVHSKLDLWEETMQTAQIALRAWLGHTNLSALNGQSGIDFARADSRRAIARGALRRDKAVLENALSFAMSGRAARTARACFPWWRRQAFLSSARRRLADRQEANLRRVEDMRARANWQQLRWARWGAYCQPRLAEELRASEVLLLWRNYASLPRHMRASRQHGGHGNGLKAAEDVLRKTEVDLHGCFVAWLRLTKEEEVINLEAKMRKLEAQLARTAGEQGTLPELEQRLAFKDGDEMEDGQEMSESGSLFPAFEEFAEQPILPPPDTKSFAERLGQFTFGLGRALA